MIDVAVLREARAGHDQELVASLGRQLTARYGRGYDRTNLFRMVRFSQQLTEPDLGITGHLNLLVVQVAATRGGRSSALLRLRNRWYSGSIIHARGDEPMKSRLTGGALA